MRLTHLSLSNFRNFARLDASVPGGPVLLVGDNAQGKTSLLEAIYYLATLDSFHASSDRQLINFLAEREEQPVARIVALFQSEGRSRRLEVRIILDGGRSGSGQVRKEVLLDGVKVKSGAAAGQFMAVLFLPQMMTIIEGAPEERRRYLNQALSQISEPYAKALNEYTKALTQRNALLKQLGERQGDPAQLDYWDEALAKSGAQLIQARIRAVHELELQARQIHAELTQQAEVLRLDYQPAYDPAAQSQIGLKLNLPVERRRFSQEEIRSGLLQRLIALRTEEIARGVTTLGPHRDELRLLSNGVDLGLYGSRGQVRTALLSLKLAEVNWMHQRTNRWPVLLLDEVLAELDVRRRSDLLKRLSVADQALLTTTDLDLFPAGFIEQTSLWRIQAGRLVEEIKHVAG